MIKKYISKFTIDILPSIIATIVGAYIVNHYVIPKSGADAPPAASVASTPDPKVDAKASEAKTVSKPAETSSDVADAPAATKGKIDKPAVEKASIEKPESASESRRHQPAIREKTVAKAAPAPVVTPPVTTVSIAPADAAQAIDDHRDANDLARAAIERLRSAKDAQKDVQEAVKTPEPPRVPDAPRIAVAPAMQQLPPPINVSTPNVDTFAPAQSRPRNEERAFDPRRPPGDIPQGQPLDIEADATASAPRARTNVAEDVLSAARSVFHSVIPKRFDQ
jgi:hypothetical protein